MILIGCDFHTRFQQIAMLEVTTGELVERRLEHENGDAERFYATLPGPARVGMEATINAQWFERLLQRYQHRTVDRRCGGDSGGPGTKTEDGRAGCSAHSRFASDPSLPSNLDSLTGGTRRPPVSAASA